MLVVIVVVLPLPKNRRFLGATGEYHVYRGGGWYIGYSTCRCTHRRQTKEGYSEYALGVRVALREKVEL